MHLTTVDFSQFFKIDFSLHHSPTKYVLGLITKREVLLEHWQLQKFSDYQHNRQIKICCTFLKPIPLMM